ncbi:MAG: threonine synthase [Candidatus Omnitrophica bacterium]|nr:threonine synthase [Candidatus Omnitrophota bacterium]
MAWKGVIAQYRKYLPVTRKTPIITLLEGNTPLIPAPWLAGQVGGGAQVWLKFEGMNPSGSFKDRGMTMAVSKALEQGSQGIICASTGNTSASAAAYGARAGLRCIVVIPEGAIAMGKLAQAVFHGAEVVAIKGNFDEALKLVRQLSEEYNLTLVNSVNPYRIQGQKSGAYEICDALGEAPDYHFIPVGNAGNIRAYWLGYNEYKSEGKIKSLPKMMGFQAAGAAPIVKGRPIAKPETFATAIRIGNPASWVEAVAARDESKGLIDSVTEGQIRNAYKVLAKEEGVFCEPASAASVAGLLKMAKAGALKKRGARYVCILTGHGLKDPSSALDAVPVPRSVSANIMSVARRLQLKKP